MRNCKDHAGATTGIPDIPFVTAPLAQQCSDESFPIAPPTIHCGTKDQHPQTYDANVARGYYFTKKYGDLHGIYIFSRRLENRTRRQLRQRSAACATSPAGHDVRSDGDFDLSADAHRARTRPSSRR